MHIYKDNFMSYSDRSGQASAKAVIDLLLPLLSPRSVLDVGCARGTWLSVWRDLGHCEVVGIDGDYVNLADLRIAASSFQSHDLHTPLRLGRRFDLAQSLEVAEHLPEERAAGFVADLVAHADIVLFAAARPGQGGEHHINEQPYDYWRALFSRHDYVAIDFLRPALRDQAEVSSWYRYNTLLYVARHRLDSLPAPLIASRLPDDRPVPDFAPQWFRIRCALVRLLPVPVQNVLAQFTAILCKR